MFKSKLMLPILAVIVGAAASAFTTVSKSHATKSTARAGTYYFEFNGMHNRDEDNIAKWNYLGETSGEYNQLECDGQLYGCGIEVNDTVHISNGSGFDVRPKGVDVTTGPDKNPTLGTYVTDFRNFLEQEDN